MVITQDMPPPGGFGSIDVKRVMPKPLIKAGAVAAIIIGLTFNGFHYMRENMRKIKVFRAEQVEHFIAAQPFLYAEMERKFLRHLRELRDEEREIMKDHPGWIVGTLYGEKIFKTLPPNALPPISALTYTASRPDSEWYWKALNCDSHQ